MWVLTVNVLLLAFSEIEIPSNIFKLSFETSEKQKNIIIFVDNLKPLHTNGCY